MTELKRPERYVQPVSIKPKLSSVIEFYTQKTNDYQDKLKQINEYADALETEISILKENPKIEILLDNTDKQLVVVPKIVDEFIEEAKGDYTIYGAFTKLSTKMSRTDIGKWVFASKERQMLFARAWLDGYTVEKEKLQKVVFLKTGDDEILLLKSDTFFIDWISIYNYLKYQFTEKEIKDIDERYWAFVVPVEEVKP